MTFITYCEQALLNLTAAKLRSFIALVGILIGTAAVVALINCGQLATSKALQQFKSLGTDLVSVSLFPKRLNKSQNENPVFTAKQWQELASHIPYILEIAPYATAYQPLSFEGKPLQGAVIGADESLSRIVHIDLDRGHFVSFLSSFEHFCVIGNGLAHQIQTITQDDPIGKQLRIGRSLYTIIGVGKKWKENPFFNEDINQSAIIPLKGIVVISQDAKTNFAVVLLKPESPIDKVIAEIKKFVESTNPKFNVYARSSKQIITSMQNQGRIFRLLLAVISGVSLLVGGIGVMNVMLVSVSERKKEIGIRKAVGAKNNEIQTLFIIESLMLSVLGGLLGIIVGELFTAIVAHWSDWDFSIHFSPIISGFVVSAATGIFFGFYPAHRAAQLEPMGSLRSE